MGLTKFERDLVRKINNKYNKKYKGKDLMEWSTSEKSVREGSQKDESIYKIGSVWIAMKD